MALTTLEEAVLATPPMPDGTRPVTEPALIEALGQARYAYDRQGEDHYNLISALIKSLRNSDVNASLYWLARLIEGGADPLFIARRLCILASEDIGLADPQAMIQAAAAAQIVHLIGMPEGLFPLSQATIYLANAPKSNAVTRAYSAAAQDAAATAREARPSPLTQCRHTAHEVCWVRERLPLRPRRPTGARGDALPARVLARASLFRFQEA